MTPKEALKDICENGIRLGAGDFVTFEALKEAAAALRKQIPKEHHHTRVVEVKCKARESVCPACLGVIITTENEYPKHCDWCGQALVWREGEERW